MGKHIRRLVMFFALTSGFLLGVLSSAFASPQWSFAGYKYQVSHTGVNAYIAYKNPSVPTGFSTEWVMSGLGGSGANYIQVGWMKYSSESSPHYFGEYGCSGFCRTDWETVPANTTHLFEVSTIGGGTCWCYRIDGVCRLQLNSVAVGFTTGLTQPT